MLHLRIFCLILVLGWSYAQILPQPIKSQIALGASSETETIVTAVVLAHIPNTDKIVAAWAVGNSNQNSSWAYIRGAVASTSGDVVKQFDVSTDSTMGFQQFTAPLVVPLKEGGFAIFYYNALVGNTYYMRRYDSDLNPVSEPNFVAIHYRCIQPTAALDTNGDIIIACPRAGSTNFLVYRINSTGDVLNSIMYPVPFQNVHPSMALSGDSIAVSMIRVVSAPLDLRLYMLVLDKDLNVVWGKFEPDHMRLVTPPATEFTPFENVTIVLSSSLSASVNQPNVFSALSMGVDPDSGTYMLHAVKFNNSTILSQHRVPIPTYLQSLGTSLNDQGQGLFFCSTYNPNTYVTFALAQSEGDQIFALNQSDFHTVHSLAAAESNSPAYPFADLVHSVTTWATGGAVAWPEISTTSGVHYARITIYGTYCGDYLTEGPEQCDGGVDCRSDCTCPTGQISDTRSGCMNPPVAAPRSPPTVTPVIQPPSMSGTNVLSLSALLILTVSAIVFLF